MNRSTSMYQDMASRTGSSIYIGVVGPVRTGKSTFIKRFMETQVLPNIENDYRRERARDELPQSGSGRTIMTAEPKFVPEEAAEVHLPDGTSFSVRLIDCVGYMVPGAVGQFEDLVPRMVMTPWYDHEIPMTEAAELGTRKVICDHSTVGIVVTTDGSVTDIPRSDYLEAEERVIRELQELGKPFVVLVNSLHPEEARLLAEELQQKYGVRCLAVNCLELGEGDLQEILRSLLYEFPVQELQLFFPEWVEALPPEHPIPAGLYHAVGQEAKRLEHVRQLEGCMAALEQSEQIDGLLLLLNTVGGDIEAGLAIAELVSGMTKPVVTLVLGGGHSIGVPLAVCGKTSFIAPSASMTLHPVRMSGTVIAAPETYRYFERIQERIVDFVAKNSRISAEKFRSLMLDSGDMANDVGTVLYGKQAVEAGLIDRVGTLSDALEALYDMVEQGRKQSKK